MAHANNYFKLTSRRLPIAGELAMVSFDDADADFRARAQREVHAIFPFDSRDVASVAAARAALGRATIDALSRGIAVRASVWRRCLGDGGVAVIGDAPRLAGELSA